MDNVLPYIYDWDCEDVRCAAQVLLPFDAPLQQGVIDLLAQNEGVDYRKMASVIRKITGYSQEDCLEICHCVVGAAMAGVRFKQSKDAGMTHKRWLTPRGKNAPCPIPSHLRVDSSKVLPIDEPFCIEEAHLMYPRNFASGFWQHCIGCQCVVIGEHKT